MRRRHERGNAAIEFAIGFGVFWSFFAGVFMFGFSLYLYNNLNTAVAMGARYAARVDFDEPDHAFVNEVKNVVVYGSPAGGTRPLVSGLTTDRVSVTWATDAAGIPQTITVSVQNYSINAVFTTFTLNKPQLTVKYEGTYRT